MPVKTNTSNKEYSTMCGNTVANVLKKMINMLMLSFYHFNHVHDL